MLLYWNNVPIYLVYNILRCSITIDGFSKILAKIQTKINLYEANKNKNYIYCISAIVKNYRK